jgi:hypothetical protein
MLVDTAVHVAMGIPPQVTLPQDRDAKQHVTIDTLYFISVEGGKDLLR